MANAGPPIHGNYHGYYSKRPFVTDPRLDLLPPHMFKDKRVLDVGCNEGAVTCQIAQSRQPSQVVGVDIDDSLVRAAWRRRRSIWSTQAPEPLYVEVDEPPSPKKRRCNSPSPSKHLGYFPSSCEHMFGPLPILPGRAEKRIFPHNVSFRTADWVNHEIPEDKDGYDVVIAFSVSKWIHLNGGDTGIRKFFGRVFSLLPPGGVFVLEPQPWEGYSKAKRMSEELKENAKTLKLRPEQFESVLQEMGFSTSQRLDTADALNVAPGFRRPIDVYVKDHG